VGGPGRVRRTRPAAVSSAAFPSPGHTPALSWTRQHQQPGEGRASRPAPEAVPPVPTPTTQLFRPHFHGGRISCPTSCS